MDASQDKPDERESDRQIAKPEYNLDSNHDIMNPTAEQREIVSRRFSNLMWSINRMDPIPQSTGPRAQDQGQLSAQEQFHLTSQPPHSSSQPFSNQVDMDKCNPFARAGLIKTPTAASPAEAQRAHQALVQHMADRFPRLSEASKRLNKVMGMYCDEPFTVTVPPAYSPLSGAPTQHLLREAPAAPLDPSQLTSSTMESLNAAINAMPKKGSAAERNALAHQMLAKKPPPPPRTLLTAPVEPVEVVGLRETMLRHAAQPYGNQKKTELRSMSFYDWTSDMKTGKWANQFLAHLECAGKDGARLTMYEVDV